jgi:hypothetical protein
MYYLSGKKKTDEKEFFRSLFDWYRQSYHLTQRAGQLEKKIWM